MDICISVQFSHSVMCDSLRHHGLKHTRPSCPSPAPGIYSNSCLLSWWCYSTISSSVVPFSSHLKSFQASGSFQMSQFFASGGQSIGVSASVSVLPMIIQDWFLLGWTAWITLLSIVCIYNSAKTISKMSLLYCVSTKDARNNWILENLLFQLFYFNISNLNTQIKY